MAGRVRNMHQVLGPYLQTAAPPTAVTAPTGTGPRLPVGPTSAIPQGLRPIPTTTESNKKTNVQIPYVRRATEDQGVGGTWSPTVAEGAMVLVERQPLVPRVGANERQLGVGVNSYVDVLSVEQVNERVAEPRAARYTYEDFPYRLDGVVNNVDSVDSGHEYRDYTIVNVAVQGHVRLDHRERTRADFLKCHPSSIVYLGLWGKRVVDGAGQPVKPARYEHKLVRFSSAQLTRLTFVVEMRRTGWDMLFGWQVGRIVDSNQSPGMISLCVQIEPLRNVRAADVESQYVAVDPATGTNRYVLRWHHDLKYPNAHPTRAGQLQPALFGDEVRDVTAYQALLCKWMGQADRNGECGLLVNGQQRTGMFPPYWRSEGSVVTGR